MNPSEETMMECLSACGLRELPPKLDATDKRTWLRAICEVLKVGGRREFCLCENDGKGTVVIKRDFGICASIVQVCAIHPFEFADKTIVPTFKRDAEILHYLSKSCYDRAEIEKLLSIDGKSPEQIEADRSEITRRINDVALGMQKRKADEKKRVEEIKKFAENAKSEKEKSKNNGRKRKKE